MRPILAALATLAALALPAMAQDRPSIITVNYPLAYFAERLTGGAADVTLPVPEGQDPSLWRPRVADISAMQSADAILLNGAGFAGWITKASLPRSKLVDTSRGLEDAFIETETVTHSHGADGAHSHDAVASYLWLDLSLAAEQAKAAAKGLERRAPAEGMAANLDALLADLAALDTEAKALAPLAEGRTILASHPRYQYFARAYGLTIDSLEWGAGAMPSEEEWAKLQTMAEGAEAPVFLWEAEPPAEARARMAELGIADMVFPPLAMPPAEGDFVSALSASIAALSALLSDTRG